ncbi:MAG: 3-deoxy-manno-octulosonate cytidylyltransferase [Gammaproteobacteria bacterium]|nr:3-deoxy-manno-octulosonate cytidylyltransferase [Gammaproteobacteria bacterium]
MSGFSVVIPARFGSTRLPGKPLIELAGKTMIERVAERALRSGASKVIIATDDKRVVDAVKHLPVQAMLTSQKHVSGSDRVQEIASHKEWDSGDVVVNVQGDEPLIPPAVIDQVADLLEEDDSFAASTLSEPLHSLEEVLDPNIVKVVCDLSGRALYFSRAAIPWDRDQFPEQGSFDSQPAWRRHIGIYAYRVGALNDFVVMPKSQLERIESLEQLRFIENGYSIVVADACEHIPAGVDTETDVMRVRQVLRDCPQ